MKTFTIKEMVKSLTGSIRPIGESSGDEKRLSNLSEFIELVDGLVDDLKDVAGTRDNGEGSIVAIKRRAKNYIRQLNEELTEFIDE